MKNTIKISTYILLVFTGIAAISCSSSDLDNTKPTINNISPVHYDVLYVGESIPFKCTFSDDVELQSYKIEIHSNFDGHTHGSRINDTEDSHPWTYSKTWEFEAGKQSVTEEHQEIQIPLTVLGENNQMEPLATGNYHFGVYCMDAAKNESMVFVEVFIEEK